MCKYFINILPDSAGTSASLREIPAAERNGSGDLFGA
jgi:hypothetical protein